MARNKRKKFLAWILSGALLAGSLSPITSNAAETSDKIGTETTDEKAAETQASNEGEDSVPETDREYTEEGTEDESAAKEGTSEENAPRESTTEEDTAEDSTSEENITQESTAEEDTSEESTTGENETETETEETEEEIKAVESDRQISENILKDFNTSFENLDAGSIGWWSDNSWNKTYVAQKSYAEDEKPASECGDYYLEVSPEDGKSVAQICHENIAKIVKPEVTYEFTYFAKLSDGQSGGEVQLQITSISKDWKSSKSAEVTLDNEVTLNNSQWQQVSGTFKIPAHDKNEQIKIEFTGSENLVFCIDDLRIAAIESDKEISENILKDYNTSFENLDAGSIGWWSDNSWGKTYVAQKSYAEDEKPASECGDYYLEVSPENGKSIAQICHANIAKIIKPEVTYRFSYFAKLSEGQESGEVRFQVTSASTDWNSQKPAEFTFDNEVTLSADQWQQVSGTFKIPAHDKNEQVKIEFAGSEGLSFCVDDLRVAALESGDVNYGDNLVKNPNFAESDLSVWESAKGSADITAGNADEAVFDDITTYGIIENRDNSQQCFAQDMTDVIFSGRSYNYSFYVMLDAEDYKNAPAEQREVCFAPYVRVDGKDPEYWGSYSTGILDNACIKRIPAGEWVKFEGSFNPKFEGEADALVIRILEQGTNYGSGDCVKGKYYVTGVSVREVEKPVKDIEWDIPNLKDTVSSDKGIGTLADHNYTGTSIMLSEISDENLMNLVTKHFNVVTFGNELKMDALFGYHDGNNTPPGFETVTWTRADGTLMENYKVPTLDYSRAEKMLDAIKAWNDENPDDFIKVRGHVLVWHSQAPEWFFHEDWDKDKPDVSAEVMDARQEWYIKTVLEHFTGEDSPYKDMFYGWDVVNEAVSDGRGTYRDDTENSSWWRVYRSEDFIINAFRYANKYAPKSIELYYNDYNECMGNKVDGIAQLLKDVKAHENDEELPTRISGMGMQAHYTLSSPTVNQIRDAAVKYGKIVGKVQLTELDFKASDEFDGTDATLQSEYTRQAYRYKEVYDVMREIDAMDDIDVNGLTIWGVIDGNSWLQTSNSVGGASDGSKRQVPLLFDDDYKAKPAFYAFVNAEALEPFIRSITVIEADQDNLYANGKSYPIQGIDASFIPVWTEAGLNVQVTVSDDTVDEADGVKLYIDWDKSMSEGASILRTELKRTACQAKEGGYVAEFEVARELLPAVGFGMDVVVTDNENSYAFNDLKMTQDTSSKYFASAITKPYMTIGQVANGTISVDGETDGAWEQAQEIQLRIRSGNAKASAVARLLWDEQYLYVLADVTDSALDKTAGAAHEQDSLEVFIDENNHKSDSYEEDDKQYRVNYANSQSYNGPKCNAENIVSAAAETDKGYRIEAAYRWTDITPVQGDKIGIELQINDAEGGTRIGTVSWYDESGQGWSSPGVFGTATLGGMTEAPITKEELGSLITEYDKLNQEDYTEDSWTSFAAALEEARAVLNNEAASQEAVKKAYDDLKKAKDSLIPSTITAEGLKNLIAECGALKPDKDKYTEESWTAFADALDQAEKTAANPDASQAEIESAYKSLVEARTALKPLEFEPEMPIKKELSSLIAECDELKQDDYTEETWIPFARALENAIAALGSSDTSQEEMQTVYDALKEAKSGLRKHGEPEPVNKDQLKELLSKCETLNQNDYTTESWASYTKALEEAKAVANNDAATQAEIQSAVEKLSEALEQLKEREGLWAVRIAALTYTGKALKPEVSVYNGRTLLTKGKDYTISYKNNTKVSKEKMAEAVIKGKGNYAGSITETFEIVPKNLNAEDIAIPDLYVKAPKPGRSVAPQPVVTRNGKKLTKKEYSVSGITDKDGNPVTQVTASGTYTVKVTGTEVNGYTGTRDIRMTVLSDDQKLMSAAKVTGSMSIPYTGEIIVPEFTVKYGTDTLVLNQDYTVICDSKEVGTATAVIRGTGTTYVGEKTVTFKITGTALKAKDVTLENAANAVYTGTAIEPVVKVAGDAVMNRDYIVSYDNNVKAGTASVTVKGIGKYSGTVKKTFKIASFDINKNDGGKLTYNKTGLKAPYRKGGSKLSASDLNVAFDGVNLTEGVDYTLAYTANKKVSTETSAASVKLIGKGNFKGTTDSVAFAVETQNIANLTDIFAADVLKKNAKNYKSVSPVIKDVDGKALKKGTDFTVIAHTMTDGITPFDTIPNVGDTIRVTVAGDGNNYEGTTYADFRIIEDNKNISKAKVTVEPQTYTGKEITISETDPVTGARQITVKMKVDGKTETLAEGVDYEIVKTGYSKNIDKGTGKMTIRGINDYGGTKTVTFKINANAFTEKNVEWYNSLYSRTMSWFGDIFNN